MFARHNEEGYIEVLPGILRKTLAYGDKTLMAEFVLAKGCDLPFHAHPYEQTGYLVKGHLRLTCGETFDVRSGDSWSIPMNVEHGAQTLEDSIAIEVFSPVRADYLPEGLTECRGVSVLANEPEAAGNKPK